MKKISRIVMACVIAASSLMLASVAAAQEKGGAAGSKGTITDMNSYRCKDIMRMSGDDDRGIPIALMHGYFLGKKGATSFDPDVLAKVTDDFTDYCLDHPDVKALEAFAKVYK
ncbi:HdeA/HdeB family chaperone [Paraburkholderia sediminicola]|uniref:HdeA/HdeB family chaperone n=1 Tax=Paraburkholderia sediminicola TaxID=458836 RepID=UPI0038B6CA4C